MLPRGGTAMRAREIEFFFDVGSPYSYLAATQIDAVGARHAVPVRWRPFLLGAVFKASGNTMPALVPAKARWMLSDLQRWAAHYAVPFRMSSRFPLNTLRPQRALIAARHIYGEAVVPRFALALFNGYWVEDVDITTDGESLTVHVRIRPEIRASAESEMPPDPRPAPIGLLPNDEYIVTAGEFAGQRGFFSRDETGAVAGVDLSGRLFSRIRRS